MDENEDNNTTTGNPSTFLNLSRSGAAAEGGVSNLEQDVLDEYARLARNMKTVRRMFVLFHALHPITTLNRSENYSFLTFCTSSSTRRCRRCLLGLSRSRLQKDCVNWRSKWLACIR